MFVMGTSLAIGMIGSVYLDYKSEWQAYEVGYVFADDVLTAESLSKPFISDSLPKHTFCLSGMPSAGIGI